MEKVSWQTRIDQSIVKRLTPTRVFLEESGNKKGTDSGCCKYLEEESNGVWVKSRESEGGRRVGELEEQQTNDNNTSTFVCFLRKILHGLPIFTREVLTPRRQAVACVCPQANNRAIWILCKRR
jgi:hypothetical protein